MDIVNVCNEVVLCVVRYGGEVVIEVDFDGVIECVIVGFEWKFCVLGKDEKKIVVYYEVGYVVCGWFFEYVDFLFKVFIIFCGVGVLGYV